MADLTTAPTESTGRSTCPSCENTVTNVHGIYTCSTCSWISPGHR